jgi:hypothetical protein
MKNLFIRFNNYPIKKKFLIVAGMLSLLLTLFSTLTIIDLLRLSDMIHKLNGHQADDEAIRLSADKTVTTMITFIVLFSGLIVGISMTVGSMAGRYINGFTEKMTRVIKFIERGVFAYRIDDIKYDDDLGDTAWALNNMLDQF